MRVLIADDHPLIRSAMKLLLESDGHEVVAEADNGADAVQLARKHNVDLIILDITMPGLDGLEVINESGLRRLKSHFGGHVPIPPVLFAAEHESRGGRFYYQRPGSHWS